MRIARMMAVLGKAPAVPVPSGDLFWKLKPAGAVSLTIKFTTSDGAALGVTWGDGTSQWVAHNTNVTHNYAGAGTYDLEIYEPTRVLTVTVSGGAVARKGDVTASILTNATAITMNSSSIETFECAACSKLATLSLTANSLADLVVSGCPLLGTCTCGTNALLAAVIDQILIDLDTAGLTPPPPRLLFYRTQVGDGNLNANRSVAGAAAQASLAGKGWTVTAE